MMPAHSSGASSASGYPSGNLYAKSAGTVQNSAYPPSASQPVYVDCGQRFSAFRVQYRQVPQVPRSQATPARCPGDQPVTPDPVAATTPTTSCPGDVCG